MIKRFWDTLADQFGRTARTGLVVGSIAILLFLALGVFWLLRSDYQPLFTELTPQDTAAMTAELDRQKIPYVLSDQGNNACAIMVDKNDVYKTRIKLMGKDIPLHGTVGFELFNNSDFGMTEFAQKINYQRALQGELARTILSLTEIRDARVLLALPEQGLFKQATNKPKASVTISMKQQELRLRPEQVTGIQRLVSSAVPNISAQDVTIVDQNGVALTRLADSDAESGMGGGSFRLDMKKETEAYLSRKAMEVLERALGAGQAMASVDVTLNMERIQSSTDEILSSPGKLDGAPTGVVVRERETTRELDPPLNGKSADGGAGSRGGSNQSEVEYAVGHHIEQVVSQPGSIQRLQVAVVVKKALSKVQQEQLQAMVSACIGASADRGDSVVVQTLDGLIVPTEATTGHQGATVREEEGPSPAETATSLNRSEETRGTRPWSVKPWDLNWTSLVVLVSLGAVLGYSLRRNLMGGKRRSAGAKLTEAERRAALHQVQTWLRGQQHEAGSTSGATGISEGAIR